ncbi:MAG TPA: hypothetical protein VL403_20065 [Candidatus Kryptonia bacterium]|nr:hypothetical protein [Candidatus Kryptonia bacterium]
MQSRSSAAIRDAAEVERMTIRQALWIAAVATVALFARVAASRAAIKEIEATGRYQMGDNDSKLDGHRLALMEAKRNALEKAGTYVENITEVKDFQLTRDDIRSYTAGIVEVNETTEPKWEMIGSNLRVTVTVDARIDTDVVSQRIAALHKDQDATEELRAAKKKSDAHEREIKELNRKLKKAKKGSPEAKRDLEARNNAFAGVDAATLKAQAAAAKTFSQHTWEATRDYVNKNVNLKGCMPFKSGETTATAGRDLGGLVFLAPAVGLILRRPAHKRLRRRCRPSPTSSRGKRDAMVDGEKERL